VATGLRTLAGRYRLEGVIGRGGMSTVYRATDLVLGRTVAVKVLLDVLAEEDPSYVARFEREARAAAALHSPAVVTVYDSGADGASRYIVMEHVAGESLAARLRREGRLAAEEAVRVAREVAAALATAHAAGILHRDVKPANVMLTPAGGVKVLDFGIARPLHEATLTHVSSLVGTAAYMPPERATGGAGDERSDVYSLGCLLYAMLTGDPPFRGEVPAALLHQHLSAAPQPPSRLAPGVPPPLDRLVLEMLAKDPARRPQTASEVRNRLKSLGRPTAVTEPVPGLPAPAGLARRPGWRGRGVLALLAAAAILIGGGVALLAAAPSHRQQARVTSTPVGAPPPASVSTATPPTTVTVSAPAPKPKHHPGAAGRQPPPGHGGVPPGQAKKAKGEKPPKPGH